MARRKSVKFSAKPAHEPDVLLDAGSTLTGAFIPAATPATAPRADPAGQDLDCGLCGRAVYRLVYALSFGCVFSTMMVSRLLPGREIIVRGLGDGAAAAKQAAGAFDTRSDTIPAAYHDAVAGLDSARPA